MNAVARVDEVVNRERLVDLSYSLYECLADLLTDVESIDRTNEDDIEGVVERISISSMNCMGDIRLLVPMFESLSKLRD
jgi:hypothetical protein